MSQKCTCLKLKAALGDKIYVPRAIEYSGQVITVYDPIVHSAAEAAGLSLAELPALVQASTLID